MNTMTDVKKLFIIVTQEHIDKGTPRDSCKCPIALAIMDHPDVTKVLISYAYIVFRLTDGAYYRVMTDDFIKNFMDRFDSGDAIYISSPFSFFLPLIKAPSHSIHYKDEASI